MAGPDVFLPDATAVLAEIKAVCAAEGLAGVSPLDPLGLAVDATEDTAAMLIEAFDLFDNIMIDAAIAHSGGSLTVVETDPDACWTDPTAFRRCVAAAARVLV